MKTVLVPLVLAALLLLAGAFLWMLGDAEEQVARLKTGLATLDFASVAALQTDGFSGDTAGGSPVDADDGSGRSLAYATRVPGIGGGLRSQVGDGRATAAYWLARYSELALQRDAGGALLERDPELLLLAANAGYRASRLDTGDRESAIQRLTAIVRTYADVLKTLGSPENAARVGSAAAPEHHVLENAAYNYELTVRLLAALERARPGSTSATLKLESPPSTIHGRPGGPPENTPMEQFRVVIPRRSDERNQDPEGGQGQQKIRRG